VTLLPQLFSHVRALAPSVRLEAATIGPHMVKALQNGEAHLALGLPAILSTTDLIATLPRHIGETLAASGNLQVLRCPVAISGFTVKQHWHARYHHDPATRWLRQVCAHLFLRGR